MGEQRDHPVIREANGSDRAFLQRMFAVAVQWDKDEPGVGLNELLQEAMLARYFAEWGRSGDVALVGLDGIQRVGAAWFRTFPAETPGYGFVSENIPEIGIAVVPPYRSRGIGGLLLNELQDLARARGYLGLSLSVDRRNPAQRLYERLGFVPVPGKPDGAMTMLWQVRGA